MDFYLLDNSNTYFVRRLRDDTGALVNSATISIEVRQNNATGGSVQVLAPLSFSALGNGDYKATLPPSLALDPNTEYNAIISGTYAGKTLKESRKLFAKRRVTK